VCVHGTQCPIMVVPCAQIVRSLDGADAPKLLVLTNQTKLTLTVTLTLTDTVTVIFFTRILLTPVTRLYRNNKRNFCGGVVAGFVGGPVFPFSDF